ncbi:MAG: hypothetical protein R3F11_03840 [Verrucomicrobiales bacterium]
MGLDYWHRFDDFLRETPPAASPSSSNSWPPTTSSSAQTGTATRSTRSTTPTTIFARSPGCRKASWAPYQMDNLFFFTVPCPSDQPAVLKFQRQLHRPHPPPPSAYHILYCVDSETCARPEGAPLGSTTSAPPPACAYRDACHRDAGAEDLG